MDIPNPFDVVFTERVRHLSLATFYVCATEVDGDIVEFGVGGGTSASIIATAMASIGDFFKNNRKKLYLFDSFKGLPESTHSIDKECLHVKLGAWEKGAFEGSKERAMEACSVLATKDELVVYEGWFKDTLPKLSPKTVFAMLHIDCDLYESTIDILGACFSRGFIAEGAIILFDDWSCNRASPAFGEQRAWGEMVRKYSVNYSDEGGYAASGHKFIIHSYGKIDENNVIFS